MRGRWLCHAAGVLMVVGGISWIVAFLRLAAEHPSLDSPVILWPFVAMEVLAMAAVLLRLGRWLPTTTGSRRVGISIVALSAAGVVPVVTVIASIPFMFGTLVLGLGLARLRSTRWPGIALAVGMGLFLATRLWILGPVQTGDALLAQEMAERSIAFLLGGGWILLGMTCLRDERRVAAGLDSGSPYGT